MATVSLRLSKAEVAVIRPALEDMLNGIVEACCRDRYPRRDATLVPYRGEEVYRERRYDEEMAGHVLSCRNKLKFKGKSHMVRLNCFELAGAALALRVVRREKLVYEDLLASSAVADLEHKLELHRKRAKRAAIKLNEPAPYKEESDRWTHFVEWMRYNLLYYRPRRKSYKHGTLFYKDQRETMRALAMQVVVETADQEQIHHFADLARREIRRQRHGMTLRSLLEDHDQVRQFLAKFILKRDGPDILAPKFQPLCVCMADRAERLKLALVLGGVD
jgi:hypothetical protein